MTRYLSFAEVLELHHRLIVASGGAHGHLDIAALESALALPQMTFGGADLYPDLADKAAALGFSIISNHPFVDGNKRVGHAAMETFLVLNGAELSGDVDEQERVTLAVASGTMKRDAFTTWVRNHVFERTT